MAWVPSPLRARANRGPAMVTAVFPFSQRISSISWRSSRTNSAVERASPANNIVTMPMARRRPMDESMKVATLANTTIPRAYRSNGHAYHEGSAAAVCFALNCRRRVTPCQLSKTARCGSLFQFSRALPAWHSLRNILQYGTWLAQWTLREVSTRRERFWGRLGVVFEPDILNGTAAPRRGAKVVLPERRLLVAILADALEG